ncbi:MAG: hypothetical protein Q4E06_09790 [Lautropia sp.]|nr:hypothetical protein [Lautropia sp.]
MSKSIKRMLPATCGVPAAVAAAVLALTAAPAVQAADLASTLQLVTQSEFRTMAEDLGSGLAYRGLAPAESLGVLGFDISAAVTGLKLQDNNIWTRASGGDKVDKTIYMSGIRLHKGLPGNVDIEGYYSQGSRDVKAYGGALRWAVLPGSTLVPAVALRGSYTKLTGIDRLKADTLGLDVSVSKGFLIFTPYAGLGYVWTTTKPQNVPFLKKESIGMGRAFAGLNMNLGIINLSAEYDRTGSNNSYSLKAGLRF